MSTAYTIIHGPFRPHDAATGRQPEIIARRGCMSCGARGNTTCRRCPIPFSSMADMPSTEPMTSSAWVAGHRMDVFACTRQMHAACSDLCVNMVRETRGSEFDTKKHSPSLGRLEGRIRQQGASDPFILRYENGARTAGVPHFSSFDGTAISERFLARKITLSVITLSGTI